MLKTCWHSWLERWVKHLPYFSICSRLPILQCSAATTHNCELIWILSECHPAVSVSCIVLPATFQFLSKPWKIFASVCVHAHTHTSRTFNCQSLVCFIEYTAGWVEQPNMLKKCITRWAEDHIRFGVTACITTVVAMVMQDKPKTYSSVERTHLQKSTWCS